MVAAPKIGDTLWTSPYGQPERFGEASDTITGETKFSWLMGDSKYKREKVNKRTMRETIPRYGDRIWYTADGLANVKFLRSYRHHISSRVLSCSDPAKLRQIMAILEMVES
jgi:hypothetical protein